MLRVVLGILAVAFFVPTASFLASHGHNGFFFPCLVTVPSALFLALPSFIYLRNRGWLDLGHFVWAGLATGVLCFIVQLTLFRSWSAPLLTAGMLFWAALGAAHATIFWGVAVLGNRALRPNHSMHSDGAASGPAGDAGR
jgi:hypothetical protein